MVNAEESSRESLGVLRIIQRVFPGVSMHFIRKSAHFAEYFLLGILSWTTVLRFFKSSFCYPSAYCMIIACLDEGLQRFVPGRSGEFKDIILDITGSMAAILILKLIACCVKRRHQGGREDGTG